MRSTGAQGANQPPGNRPFVRSGDEISVELLNKIISTVESRINGAEPIRVQKIRGGLTVMLTPTTSRSAARTSLLLAKISNASGAPTAYQVDVYGGGFPPADPTKTGVDAFPVDLAAAAFAVGDQVTVFSAAGKTWIDTSHPWADQTGEIAGKIITNNGGGDYTWSEVAVPGQPTLKPGGLVNQDATEINGGNGLPVGFYVFVKRWTDGNYYLDMPMGA